MKASQGPELSDRAATADPAHILSPTSEVDEREALVERWFTGTGESYDRVVHVTTVGLDAIWKRKLIDCLPADTSSALDLACGTGIVLRGLAKRFPDARLVGVDITQEYLDVAQRKLPQEGIEAELVLGNAETYEPEGMFDAVCSSYLPKYVDPDKVLDCVTPHLRRGGVFAVHDFACPRGLVPYGIWRSWMGLINTLGRRVFPAWEHAFDDELAHVIKSTRWPRRFMESLRRHGYERIRRQRLHFNTANIVSAVRG